MISLHQEFEGQVVCEFRRTVFSERREVRGFAAGATVAEIVAVFDTPAEFAVFGAVILYDPARDGFDERGLPKGHELTREYWQRVRPKAGTAIFMSTVPQGGGGGGSGKSVFALVAAVALIALTAWVGGGGLSFLSPLLGEGTWGARIAAAAIAVGGTVGLSLLTKPPVGQQTATVAGAGVTLGMAGITQNQIQPYQQLPAVLGTFRTSPPFLAQPYTTIENGEQVVHAIIGIPGRYDISGIRLDTTPIEDLTDGILEYETRSGADDDDPLTLVTDCGFEQTPGTELSKHQVDVDNQTLLQPVANAYPKELVVRSAHRADKLRITLQFPSGVARADGSGTKVLLAFRLRIRRVGDSTWHDLPEMQFEASIRSGLRQEVWLYFGGSESDVLDAAGAGATFWPRLYYKNSEWSADTYFNAGDASNPSTNAAHCYTGPNGVYVFLDTGTFPIDQYDIGITRSFADIAGSNFTTTNYLGGLFTYRTFSSPNYTIPDQSQSVATTMLENYTTFRNEYPVRRRNMAMIAVKIHNQRVNSISALFASYAGQSAATANPADLLSFVLTGPLNGRPLSSGRLEDLSSFKSKCTSKSLSCNALITQGSIEQAAAMVAQCGEALLRRSDKWGVVVDEDRSGEDVVALFSPSNMVAALTVTKNFLAGAANGLLPSFYDETQDYAVSDLDLAVFDDGVEQPPQQLVEGVTYDGLTTAAQVTRRALRDLRAARLRAMQYKFDLHLSQIDVKKGDLVAVAHDILIDAYATGRVASFVTSSGNLVSVTLNTDPLDLPPASFGTNMWLVDNVWRLGNVWTGDSLSLSAQIELLDGTVMTLAISSISGRIITISGTVAAPSALENGCLVAIGPSERVTRRAIIGDITPADDFRATLTCVDEAPAIYQNLPAAA